MKHLLFSLSLFLLLHSVSFADDLRTLNTQQKQFTLLLKDLQKGKMIDIEGMKPYVLYPYLAYEHIRKNKKASSDDLGQFIRVYESSPLADKLWSRWMETFIAEKKWDKAQRAYAKGRGGLGAHCYYLQAKLELAEDLAANEAEAVKLWLSGSKRPSSCTGLFDLMAKKGLLDKDKYWQRITLLIDKGNLKLAKKLSKKLSSKDQRRVAMWVLLKYKAKKYLQKSSTLKLLSGKHDYDHRILLYGIKRLSRNDTEKAQKLLHKISKKIQFSTQEKSEVASYIAMQDALNHSPYALQHFAAIPDQYRDDESNTWMVRMALRQSDWKKVLIAVDSMSKSYQQKDVWRYWRARALSVENRVDEALVLYEELAQDASFYGFLASDRLQQDYNSLAVTEPDRSEQVSLLIAENIGIQRALELFDIGFRNKAKREWFYALKALNKEEKLAAAKLALEKNLPFVAIVSVAKTKDWNQTGLRFPLQYQNLIEQHASAKNIPSAWVYGVARRESAFDANIESSAKALGLMQLIPPTAKAVARKLDLPRLSKQDILVPNTNIQLGSAYLKELLDKFNGNYAKASAAYNAGPHRIPKWLPEQPLEASRWIESIPFKETRKYVRAVMAYTTIYDYKLNHKKGTNLRLSDRLAAIAPETSQ
ncbi:MAG TPA: hypothetical protein EYG68_05700 [Leucothrix mucor]|nr:hypothetical protein [Leucothrix mucor]